MALFKKKESIDFWHQPAPSSDPRVLHQTGISCIARDDGPGAIQVGWTLWKRWGIAANQAHDFLQDGYRAWRSSPNFDGGKAWLFLSDLFSDLDATDPAVPLNIYAAPRDQIEPLSVYYSIRCWTASELLELAEAGGRADLALENSERCYSAISRTRQDFVPPRSMSWARIYALNHGLPEPWTQP